MNFPTKPVHFSPNHQIEINFPKILTPDRDPIAYITVRWIFTCVISDEKSASFPDESRNFLREKKAEPNKSQLLPNKVFFKARRMR